MQTRGASEFELDEDSGAPQWRCGYPCPASTADETVWLVRLVLSLSARERIVGCCSWLRRYAGEGGLGALADRSSRPASCPHQAGGLARSRDAACGGERQGDHRGWHAHGRHPCRFGRLFGSCSGRLGRWGVRQFGGRRRAGPRTVRPGLRAGPSTPSWWRAAPDRLKARRVAAPSIAGLLGGCGDIIGRGCRSAGSFGRRRRPPWRDGSFSVTRNRIAPLP